ncbi:MAG: TIGR04283 family arsenosugar biosynthesis glycosyltransferase [Alphaproteobacteria bacterium]|nr:TIGR04283 family arsenosugar biosynthesis glycosyltransferase [Alphaproteobacteria bacterium]
MARPVSIAVVIPALDEATALPATLAALGDAAEIVVADGGSRDATVRIATDAGATVVTARGRAAQQNAGAAATTAPILLFLHADTRLPVGWADEVRRLLADDRVALAAFRLAIDGATPAERLIAAGANLRSRTWGVPYGDQALALRRTTFDALGGFPDQPIMEDWALARAARRRGLIALSHLAVTTSPRRWRRLGPVRTLLVNQAMLLGARLGISYERLSAFYRKPR